MAAPLKRTSDSQSTPKLKIDCGSKITEDNPTTNEWLSNLTYLKTIDIMKSRMTNKSILEGILNKQDNVVVKISNKEENLKYEYDIYEKLAYNNIKQIVHYYCYFECSDSLINTQTDIVKKGICNGPGSTLRVLVMDYIQNRSFGLHEWKNKDAIKSCMKQVICVCLDAFMKFGFIHGDLNCNNILIKNTTIKNLRYNINVNGKIQEIIVPVCGYKILLMDFEFSKTDGNVQQFYKDFKLNFGSSILQYIARLEFINYDKLSDIPKIINKLFEKSKSNEDALWILDLFTIIDEI